jgi:uncharacterized protein YyaL (SSP411 family)
MSEHQYTNALANETSPYLLQHAHNPVEWYPWGQEALERARRENRPILLSIGYSACHWCHVMERESFENEQVARLMNENFINIKVDREERPDLDTIYMNAVQMMTGSGGWPMTVFLTPEMVPFYGGTYFPPEDRHGMPSFPRVLLSVAQAYRDRGDAIRSDADTVLKELDRVNRLGTASDELSSSILDAALSNLLPAYDDRHGGFGRAPKFPASMTLMFLLRRHRRTGDRRPLEMVEHTLQKMASGGIYDQLGGGFHRYSVDQQWLVPHFEKMLYDNALLSRVYLEAFLLTKNVLYRRIAEETLDYVLREMTSSEGGFYSTQDADSEGHEGKFFVWTPQQVHDFLGETDGSLFCRYFDVTPEGNFEGRSILNIPRPAGLVARLNNVPEDTLLRIVEQGRKRLFEEREKRVKPGRDEKILTSWNALMMRSFAEAANALGRDDYREAARRNAGFILFRLRNNGRLLRSYKDGRAKLDAYLEDYAFLMDAFLSLYEATFESGWLEEAEQLAAILAEQFRDREEGGFFFTAEDHEQLIQRPKDFYDNATPSGNSVAAFAFQRLALLTGNEKWLDDALPVLKSLAGVMKAHPSSFGNLLCTLEFYLSNPREIAVAGDPGDARTQALLREIFGRFLPDKVVACGVDGDVGILQGRNPLEGKPAVYVCRQRVCNAPVTAPEELAAELDS